MAKTVFKDPFFEINGTDLSSHVHQVTLDHGADTPEATASGDGSHTFLPNGLKTTTITVGLRQDYAASQVDATLFSLVGASAGTLKLRPSQSAIATDNPEYSIDVVLQDYNPIDNSIGETQDAGPVFVPDATGSTTTLARATS